MLNKNVKKIIASLLVLGSLAGTAATATTEAASRDYEKNHNQKNEQRNYENIVTKKLNTGTTTMTTKSGREKLN